MKKKIINPHHIGYNIQGQECVTECPHKKDHKVGSGACTYACKHFIAETEIKAGETAGTVVCHPEYDKNNKGKFVIDA